MLEFFRGITSRRWLIYIYIYTHTHIYKQDLSCFIYVAKLISWFIMRNWLTIVSSRQAGDPQRTSILIWRASGRKNWCRQVRSESRLMDNSVLLCRELVFYSGLQLLLWCSPTEGGQSALLIKMLIWRKKKENVNLVYWCTYYFHTKTPSQK